MSVLPDGGRHSVPTWIGGGGSRIAFLTSPNACKARNVARDPRVSVSVIGHDRPNWEPPRPIPTRRATFCSAA